MTRLRLLDLFCGAGGCSMGYHRAGFDCTGVDHRPMPRYPFAFVQADALEYLAEHGYEYDVIHASPPCQGYSVGRHIHRSGARHPDLLAATRDALLATEKLWIIENVDGAPLKPPAVMLCGLMFGLKVLRHRWFESSAFLLVPSHPTHPKGNLTNSCQGYSRGEQGFVCVAGHNFVREAAARAMGITWMANRRELAQAIPPAYTEYLGRQLVSRLAE